MKVLVLGLPRTGTQSLANALIELGITPVYHMREVFKNQHQALWVQALQAKFEGKGHTWQREDFEQILAGYQGLADYPAAIFPEELAAAYPDAPIILSIRSEESWYESMMNTLIHSHVNSAPGLPMTELREKYHGHCWGGDFPANGRAHFQRHNELVRKLGARRKFLEWDVKMGWGPLTEFLGLPPVEEGKAFPQADDFLEYKKRVQEQKRAQA